MLKTCDKGHGRTEVRSIAVMNAPRHLHFPAAKQVARIERVRFLKDKTETETSYIITSLSPAKASPKRLLALNRGHWQIENRLHYVRDVSFNEDRRHHRKSPTLFATLRNFVINIFRLLGNAFIPSWQRLFMMRLDLALQVLGVP